MRKGSITPFCALSFMLIASLLFALLESARVYGLDCYASWRADTGIDSVCGEYQPLLWEQYGLLLLDGAYGTERFSIDYVSECLKAHIEENCDVQTGLEEWMGLDLFSLSVSEVLPEGYAVITDDNGELFLDYVAEREKENLPLGVAEDVYELYQQTETLETEYGGVEDSIAEAQSVLAGVKAEWRAKLEALREDLMRENEEKPENEREEITLEIAAPDTSEIENTWSCIEQMQKSGILNLIFGDVSSISQKTSSPESELRTRRKEEGTMHIVTDENWYRKMLVLSYLERYFSNYRTEQNEHFLNYEMEYVICGKDMEWENLAGTLNRIMLIREAANVAYLLQDKEKMALAETLAAVAGLMAGENPGVVKAVQVGLIGAWAYLESVLDVRALVSGEVIPLVKQEREWTTDVANILVVFDENAKAKPCADGLSYTDYLKQILFMTKNETLAYRMMEVMEMGMQGEKEYQNCRMDYMLAAIKYKVCFESSPLFSSLVVTGVSIDENFWFSKEVERSYIP